MLAELEPITYQHIERYEYCLIRDFLNANKNDVEAACRLIVKDIEWRKLYLPLEIESLSLVFKSERIYLYGHDKERNP
jgi:hypothetical protein